ncbi:MAG: 5-carboxymethyl-2-hydroxymuconate isomerase [Thiohalocapsa sp. PB-PSB1]|mgnify:CR=1 FL=1|jgi:2-keto-4-pentenoate hydratase/2-oxohepta-3-ene-1,7-dioic acid hydratase in catechol pathway|nr:MAG: hypothetical protein N838_18165 [Thiohalocapsa sp. PB-PSB1]QQO55215.1 MAG: 5-carboxymethyl-2-hydroxymuconate isomerase [Thiohalocapsa sp. PB-PSB1]HCS92838.1 5-carboxymethyl-2-hydroxymuconate isomerase [Chromatiaceae bacterium]
MHLIRFETPDGRILHGSQIDDGTAALLSSDFFGDRASTGQTERIGRLLAPIVPCNIYGIGLNYRDHATETGQELPQNPVIFMKPTTTVTGPGDPILLPAACERGPEVDYEAELGVVIGRDARNVSAEQALDYVLGYTAACDVSARRWQKHGGGGQWIRGKSFDSFCPIGPVLVTADEIPNPQALALRCVVNDEPLQQGSTSDMIFSVAELIAFLSRDTTLAPGTLILTGTPAGVGVARKPPVFLANGDRVRVEIDGIGVLENPVMDAVQHAA